MAMLNGKSPEIEARLVTEMKADCQLFVSSVGAFKLCCGATKSIRQSANTQRPTTFFANRVGHLPFDENDACVAGEIRADLESVGRPTGE
jgi:predicted nucleic acid-binding protein